MIGFPCDVSTLCRIPIERFIDAGRQKRIVERRSLWSVMPVACGLARSYGQLLVARMLVGVGESCNAPGTYSMTSDMFPRDKLARPISIIGIGQVAGSGMALLVGGWLIVWLTGLGPQTFPVVGTLKPWQMTFMSPPGVCGRCVHCRCRETTREAAGARPTGFRPRSAPRETQGCFARCSSQRDQGMCELGVTCGRGFFERVGMRRASRGRSCESWRDRLAVDHSADGGRAHGSRGQQGATCAGSTGDIPMIPVAIAYRCRQAGGLSWSVLDVPGFAWARSGGTRRSRR